MLNKLFQESIPRSRYYVGVPAQPQPMPISVSFCSLELFDYRIQYILRLEECVHFIDITQRFLSSCLLLWLLQNDSEL